jgi:hypothetical protein
VPLGQGFQLLEGDTINVANLLTYAEAGDQIRSTSVPPAMELITSVDPSGGTLVVTYDFIPGYDRSRVDPLPHVPPRSGSSAVGRVVDTLSINDAASTIWR